MKYQGIIFDFNGVMLWDTAWHDTAWKLTSQKIRGTPLSAEELNTNVHGKTNKDIFAYVLGREAIKEELPALIQTKEAIYRDICLSKKEEFRLSPGTEKLLDLLIDHHIPHTIATSSEITNLNFFIKHLELEKWFDREKIIYDNGTIPGKPEPDFYLLAAKNIKLEPQVCMVVEDSKSGLESARRAQIGKVIALGPQEKSATLKATAGVNKVITSLDEITLADFE